MLGDRATAAPALPLDVDRAFEVAAGALRGLEPPADVCGLSFGAVVAVRLAAAEPQRIRRLVLTAGFARLPRRLAAVQLALAGAASIVPAGRLVSGLTRDLPQPYRDGAREALAGVRPRDLARALGSAAHLDLRSAASAVTVPALVLCGERDHANLPLSRELARLLPQGRFAIVPGARHVANLDNPEAFNELLLAFLAAE